jgi:hypothetical protein
MSYGDGTITNADVIRESGISDPSNLFKHMPASSMGKLVLSPHVYPGTLTGTDPIKVWPQSVTDHWHDLPLTLWLCYMP